MKPNTSRLHIVPPDDLAVSSMLDVQRGGLEAHFARLQHDAMALKFGRGETIAAAGDKAVYIYVLSTGCLRLSHHASDGRRHIAKFLFAGDTAGLSDAGEFALSTEAVTPVTLTAYSRAVFDRLGEGNDRLRADILAHLSAAIRVADRQLFELSCLDARERVAAFLLRMMEQPQLVYGNRLDLPMSRQDIADHLGLSIKSICRVLASLRADGVIEAPNARVVVVRNFAALRSIADNSPRP